MPAPPLPVLSRTTAAAQVVAWAGGTTAAAVALVRWWPAPPVRPVPGLPVEDLLADAACAALLLVLVGAAAGGWASLLLAAARRGGSTRLVRLERAVVPAAVRRLAATAVGVAVLAGAGAGAASAARAPVTAAVEPLVPSWPAETAPPPPASPATVPERGTATSEGSRNAGAAGATVVVEPGDTLWGIAAEHLPAGASDRRVAAEWPRWWAANRDVVGDDPDLVVPGQHLAAPAAGPAS